MAKKGKRTAKKKDRKEPGENVEISMRLKVARIVLGIFCAVLCVFSFAALFSYTFTWMADQSLVTASDAWSVHLMASNVCGKIGFLWADFLIAKMFGLGAFVVPIFIGVLSAFCFNIRKVRLLRTFLLSVFGCIILSVVCAFISELFSVTLFSDGAGGSYGHFAALWLVSLLGAFGAGAVLFVLLFVWGVMLTPKVALWTDEIVSKAFAPKPKDKVEAENEVEIEKDDDLEVVVPPVEDEEEVETVAGDEDNDEFSYDDDEDEEKPSIEDTNEQSADNLNVKKKSEGDDIVLEIEEDDNDYLANLTEEEKSRIYDPHLDLPRYQKPSLSLLEDYRNLWFEVTRDELENNKRRIVNALASYKIRVEGITAKMGPTVTLYKVRLAEGIRVAQVKKLEEDIAISLVARGVRIVPLVDAVGIEVANEHPSVVPLKSILNSPQFKESSEKMELPVAMGITVTNEPFFFDLAKMPHLLVAGATGMGKSVGLNAIITSLLYARHPSEMKLVMVDPKKVELDFYARLEKHFLAKLPDSDEAVITDTTKVVYTLKSLCIEMDERYDLLKEAGVRKITEYNSKFLARKLNPLKGHKYLPYIVVIIDEFADLLMTAGREIEEPIARLAQKARAVGIHLVIATQRPTTNIITGTIKANFNSRIAFKVNSTVDSKTILDHTGANRLIGRGDMLVTYPGIDLTRVQCALIDTDEVMRLTNFIGEQQGYDHAMYLPEYSEDGDGGDINTVDLQHRDKLFDEAAKIVVQYQQGSTSLLQRKLNLGYNRAGRLIDQLEAAGIVGPFGGSKARDVLVTDFDQLDRILENL